MFKKTMIYVLLSCGLLVGLVGCHSSEAIGKDKNSKDDGDITIRLAHEEGSGDVQDLYANKFKSLLEDKSDGHINVDIYTAGQLGTNEDILKSLQSGAIEFAISSPGVTGSIIPENQILSIPFIFSDNLDANKKVLDESKALNEMLSEKYDEIGVKALKFWTEGFMYWTANKPLKKPADMDGLKIRTMTSPLLVKSYDKLGANPTPTDAGEVYTSLQMNMIDAQENPIHYVYSSNFHEVQDYLMVSKHQIYTAATVANESFLDSLSDDDQQLIHEVVDDVNDWSFTMQEEEGEKAMEKLEESDIDIVELSSDEREPFEQMTKPVREEYVEAVEGNSKEILDTLLEEVEEAEVEME